MAVYVVCLYSIGVKHGHRLHMGDWRSMMLGMGLRNPRTLIATGNATFEASIEPVGRLENRFEDAFEEAFGRRVDAIVRRAASFRRVVGGNPFFRQSKQDGSRVVVRLMRKPLRKSLLPELERYAAQGETLRIVRGDLWIHFAHDINRSRLLRVLTRKRLGVGTIRNWNTVCGLDRMLQEY
jgi:uncharacterized protein (DUF1697 family)